MSAPSSSSSSSKKTMKKKKESVTQRPFTLFCKLKQKEAVIVVTCRVGELLLPDLLQLQDLLQGLRDFGSADADLLILPRLVKAATKSRDSTRLCKYLPCPEFTARTSRLSSPGGGGTRGLWLDSKLTPGGSGVRRSKPTRADRDRLLNTLFDC